MTLWLEWFRCVGLLRPACARKATFLWMSLALKLFRPVTLNGRLVFLADGLKVSKEGMKMPAVNKLHQESGNNTKPTFIFGHSFQAVALLAKGLLGQPFGVPLSSRIHEGLVFSNRDKRTLLDKLVALFLEIAAVSDASAILVADAYYASRKVIHTPGRRPPSTSASARRRRPSPTPRARGGSTWR